MKILKKSCAAVVAALLLMLSCSKDDAAAGPGAVEYPTVPENAAETFYHDLVRIIRATPEERMSDLMHEKLVSLGYFSLPDDKRDMFLSDFADRQSEVLRGKMSLIPSLGLYIAAQNEVVGTVLKEFGVDTKAGSFEICNPESLFERLSDETTKLAESFRFDMAPPQTKALEYKHDPYELEYDYIFSKLAGKVRRGDMILALPTYEHQRSPMSLKHGHFKYGHAEIFIKDIDEATGMFDDVSIGARTADGVAHQTLQNWCWRSYVVGLEKDGKKIEDLSPLALWVEKYDGYPYVEWYDFLLARNAAPDSFNCMSLIWWCLLKAYDIDVAPWYRRFVTTGDVICNENVYIKVSVE